jgi:hypothetical protein
MKTTKNDRQMSVIFLNFVALVSERWPSAGDTYGS